MSLTLKAPFRLSECICTLRRQRLQTRPKVLQDRGGREREMPKLRTCPGLEVNPHTKLGELEVHCLVWPHALLSPHRAIQGPSNRDRIKAVPNG